MSSVIGALACPSIFWTALTFAPADTARLAAVNKNVTTPEGAAGVMASPRPTRYAPRSQAFSPCRGSDPGAVRKQRRRHVPAPIEPAAATARSPVSPDPHRLALLLTARSRPRLRPHQRPPRGRAVFPP